MARVCRFPDEERYYLRVQCPHCAQIHAYAAGTQYYQLFYYDGQVYPIPCLPDQRRYRLELQRATAPFKEHAA